VGRAHSSSGPRATAAPPSRPACGGPLPHRPDAASITPARLPPAGTPHLQPPLARVLPSTVCQGPNFFLTSILFPLYLGARKRRCRIDPPPSTVGRAPRPWTDLAVTAQGTPVISRCFLCPEPTTPMPSTRHRCSSLWPSSRRRGTPPFGEVLPPGHPERASSSPITVPARAGCRRLGELGHGRLCFAPVAEGAQQAAWPDWPLASPVVVALGQESAQRQFFVVVVFFLFFTVLNKCQKLVQDCKIHRKL
jgi:hypothetical protein